MPLYLCRWPNGDLSAVQSKDKDDAIWLLDEVGSASPEYLTRCPNFMVHFRLREIADPDVGLALSLELENFGEECLEAIDRLYPKLSTAFAQDEEDEALHRAAVNAALAEERKKRETTEGISTEDIDLVRRVLAQRHQAAAKAEIEESEKQNASRTRRNPK
jgi:hypothetical protein